MKKEYYKRYSECLKKITAAAVTVAMSVSFVSLPTFAKEITDYTAMYMDFEQGVTGVPNGKLDNSSIRYNLNDGDHGYVLKLPSNEKDFVGFGNLFGQESENPLEARDYIFSFDFMAPQTNVGYIMQIMSNNANNDDNTTTPMCFVLDNDGTAGFSRGGGWTTPTSDDTSFHTKVNYVANKWYTAEAVVSITDRTIDYYIGGQYVGTDTKTDSFGTGAFKFLAMFTGPDYIDGAYNADNQALYCDNFCVQYTDEKSFFTGTKVSGDDVTIEFSERPKNSLDNIKVVSCADGSEINVSDVENNGDKISFTAEGIDRTGVQYAIELPNDFNSIAGGKITDKYIYFYPENVSGTYVKSAVFTDVNGESYKPLYEIPIAQNILTVNLSGAVTADEQSILSAVSLKDDKGNECGLSAPKINGKSITFNVDNILNMSSTYIFEIKNLEGINYKATYKTNSVASQGYFPVTLVKNDGSESLSIAEIAGEDVYAKTKMINTSDTDEVAEIVMVAYKNNNGVFDVTEVVSEVIDVNSMTLVTISESTDKVIKLSVPQDADMVKTFIRNKNGGVPLAECVSIPQLSRATVTADDGIIQNEDGTISLVIGELGAAKDVSVSVKSDANKRVYEDQLLTDENGKVSLLFNMTSATSGDYTVTVSVSGKNPISKPMAYINANEYNTINPAATIDSAVSIGNVNAIENLISSNYNVLGVSKSLFEKGSAAEVSVLLADKVKTEKIVMSDLSSKEVSELVKKMFIISAIGRGNIENVFDYETELNLKTDENAQWYYKSFVTEEVQKDMTLRLKASYTTEKGFYDKVEEAYVLSIVKNPDGEGNLREVIEHFSNEIGITERGNNATYTKLKGNNFSSYAALKNEFNRLQESSLIPSGGGSSAGGSMDMGTSKPSQYIVDSEKVDEEKPTTLPYDIFDDLSDFEWAKQSIVYLAEKGIVTGKSDKAFCPADNITREEFMTLLVRAFAEKAVLENVAFTDVESGAWYEEYLGKAVAAGITEGYDDGRFGIGDNISRQDMACMLNRVAKYAGIVLEIEKSEVFSDDALISDYAKKSVYVLRDAEIINGIDEDTFAPQEFATRAQAAKVIFELLNY